MNTLGLVVFAVAFGLVLGTIGPRAQIAIELFNVRPPELAELNPRDLDASLLRTM